LFVNLYSGVRLNFKDKSPLAAMTLKAHNLLSKQQRSTVHLY